MTVGGWPVPLGIVLVVDRLSSLMLVVVLDRAPRRPGLRRRPGHGRRRRRRRPLSIFHPTYLILMAGVSNAFLAGDLFNLYVGFEILLTASYVLMTLGGTGPRIRAGITYVVVTLVSLAALPGRDRHDLRRHRHHQHGELADQARRPARRAPSSLLQSMLLVAFGIKAAVFPLSSWLPDSYPTAPAPVTAVFAGLLTKVGVYAIIRTQTLLFPGDALNDLLMLAALPTMVVGILGALAQTDIRRILSFTLVSHIGYMVFGIALSTAAGLAGAIFYVAHHIAIQTTLFLVAGLIERQGGSTSVDRLGGLAEALPAAGGAVLRAGDEPRRHPAVLRVHRQARPAAGRRRRRQPLALTLVVGGVVTSLLTLLAIARVWNRAFWRPAGQEPPADTAAAAASDAGAEGREPVPRRRRATGGPGTPRSRRAAGRLERGLAAARGRGRPRPRPRPARAARRPARAAAPAARRDGRGDRGDGRGHRRADRHRRPALRLHRPGRRATCSTARPTSRPSSTARTPARGAASDRRGRRARAAAPPAAAAGLARPGLDPAVGHLVVGQPDHRAWSWRCW